MTLASSPPGTPSVPLPPPGPRTKLEFLYGEVLGEVTRLVERLEEVSAQLAEVSRSHSAERAAEVLDRAVAASAGRARAELERGTEILRRRFSHLANDLALARAGSNRRRGFGLAAICGATALAASLVGGTLLVLAHMDGWW